VSAKRIVGYRVYAHMDDDGCERGPLGDQRGGGFSWKWYEGKGLPRPRSRESATNLRNVANEWLAANGYTRNARLVPVFGKDGGR
jgi:hypothetical protein